MTRPRPLRRWGVRTRFTALIAAVFITGGATLLCVQYLLAQQLFNTAIGTIAVECFAGDASGTYGDGGGEPAQIAAECDTVTEVSGSADGVTVTSDQTGYSVFMQQSTLLSDEVLSGLLLWSVVTLVVFTVVAILASHWLSRRSLARIGQITETTRTITRNDLHQRLDLPGPDDEIKELGDTIDTMLDRLEDSFTRQERFIANASHELRTPLTTTRTALEIPQQRGLVPDHLQPAIEKALAANERSEALIGALLVLAQSVPMVRAESAEQDAQDVSETLAHSVAQCADAARSREIAIEYAPSEQLLTDIDAVLLRLAIDNLLDNAIRHNIDGGRIWVCAGHEADQVYVEVGNTGAVLSDGEIARLKEPFNRGTKTRLTNGSHSIGLGLTLIDTIAETHGGTLTLVARPAGGLVCHLRLPMLTSVVRSCDRSGQG